MMAGPNGFHGSAGLDAFDDLAEAFLGGPSTLPADASLHLDESLLDDAPPAAKSGGRTSARIRILLQGHLPGRASLWAGPATQTMADHQQQALLLIRLAGESLGDAQVDLIAPSNHQGPSIAPEASSSDFIAAVKSGLSQASGVVICVTGEDLASKQASLLLSLDQLIKSGECEVCVLTGADDASCIAAYKLMRSVAEALAHGSDKSIDLPASSARMSVCLAGASPAKADEAFARMADASRQFLAHDLAREADIAKLIGMHSQSLHDRTTEHLVLESRLSSLREQLTAWLATQPKLAANGRSDHSTPATASSTASMNQTATSTSHVSVVGRPVEWSGHLDVSSGDPIAQVKLVMDDRGVMRPTNPPPAIPHNAKASPSPTTRGLHVQTTQPAAHPPVEEAKSRATATSPAVTAPASSGMMFPGLTALNFRCPFEKSAILAVDESGILQVLVSHNEGSSGSNDPHANRQALAEATHRLITVAGWLSANSELLGLISGGKISTAARPILHLLTDHPASVRRLLDTDIRVHLVIDEAKTKQGPTTIALN